MKLSIIILLLGLFLSSCSEGLFVGIKNDKTNSVIVGNNKPNVMVVNNKNTYLTGSKANLNFKKNPDLYSIELESTFGDINDIKKFRQQLLELDEEIKSNTGRLTIDQIITKARLLDYLGMIGKSIKLFEEEYEKGYNYNSIVINHNLARAYESVGKYNLALKRYEYLINTMNRKEYFKDVANVWKKKGDIKRYKKSMDIFEKYKKGIIKNIDYRTK